MRARLDIDHPTYECCDLLYEYQDGDTACAICGQVFDWTDLLEAFNPQDYMTEDDMAGGDGQDEYYNRSGIQQAFEWDAEQAAAADELDEELYLNAPWDSTNAVARQPARSPTQHLSRGSQVRKEGPDPLFAAIPGGCI